MPPVVALPADPTLDGVRLSGAKTAEWIIRSPEVRGIVRSLTGEPREGLLAPVAGYPAITRRTEVTFRWDALGSMRPTVEELLGVPGVHELVVWRAEFRNWYCDGVRREFFMPWRLALGLVDMPDGPAIDPATGLTFGEPLVKVGRAGATLTYDSVDASTYATTDPGAGEVMFLQGGSRFKLETAPSAGERVYLRAIPIYRVVRSADVDEKSFQNVMREPHRVTLLERQGT